jgi:hypothetical protein
MLKNTVCLRSVGAAWAKICPPGTMARMKMSTSFRAHFLVFGFFLGIAILITWPLLTVLSTHFAGYPFGDAHEMTRHIWWFKYALQHGQPLLNQPLLGYPDGIPGVILWSDPLQFFPAWLFALFLPLPAAYNLQCLLNLALNGWAAYFLVWKLTSGQRFPALIAGVVFMAAPMMQGHLAGGHGGLMVQWPLPLLAYSLLALRESLRQPNPSATLDKWFSRFSLSTQQVARSTLFFVLLPFGHTLQLIYAGMPLIAVFGLTLLIKREWRALIRLIAVVVIGTTILVIFLLPVLQATFGTSAYTDEGGGVAFSLDILGIVTPSFNHPLFGQFEYTHRVLGVNIVEGASYIGIVAGLLALLAVWKNRVSRWWLLLAGVTWILALGPLLKIFDWPVAVANNEYSTFITLPWVLVADLPGLNLARTPGRFGFLLALCIAVLAGYGTAWLWERIGARVLPVGTRHVVSLRILVLVVTIFVILFDYQSFWPLPTYSAEVPQAVHDLSSRQDVRAVFDMPWDNVLAAKDALWLQTAHEKPMIGGHITRRTPVSPAKLTILEQTLDPALLDEAGADVVILHKQYDDGDQTLARHARNKLGEPFYEDAQVALWNVPEPTKPPQLTLVLPSGRTMVDNLTLFSEDLPDGADRAESYLYAPETGWLELGFTVGNPVPSLSLQLDGQPLYTRDISPFSDNLTLPITQSGYHTITAAVEPPCPANHDPAWLCGFQYFSAMTVSGFRPVEFDPPVQFERGVSLGGASYVLSPQQQVLWPVLWWRFDQPVTDQDVRFIKIFDKAGQTVAEGLDQPLGALPADSQRVESLTIELGDLAAGTYKICVGWYTYPDLTRFPVLSDVDGAQDSMACVSSFTIPAS